MAILGLRPQRLPARAATNGPAAELSQNRSTGRWDCDRFDSTPRAAGRWSFQRSRLCWCPDGDSSDLSTTSPSDNQWIMMSRMKRHRRPLVRRYGRLKLIGVGLVIALLGSARLLRGGQVVTHRTGQPFYAWQLIAGGGLCVILALIPLSRIAKTSTRRSHHLPH